MPVRNNCRTLVDLFNRSVSRHRLRDKNYLEIVTTERNEELSFGRLAAGARNFATFLIRNKGIRLKDKIAILGRNRADWDIALWGTILAGAVPVLIDPERRTGGVKRHLLHTNVRLLVLADDYQSEKCRAELNCFLQRRRVGVIEMTVYDKPDLQAGRASAILAEVRRKIKPADTAVILCTSGTTAEPREVELTHSNLISNVRGALDAVVITASDVLGHIMPPHHSFGLTVGKILPLWVGATNLYTNKYRYVSQLIRDRGITIFVGIPAFFAAFARKFQEKIAEQKNSNRLVRLADRYFPRLAGRMILAGLRWRRFRFFVSGAAPLPRWVLDVFWEKGIQLREGYGTTENSPIYGFNAHPKKLGSVGRPIPELSIKIVDEQNRTLAPRQIGEIVLGGPCIVKGYYKNQKATQAVIETDDGGIRWLHTGDLGYLDEDGYLFITGRKKYLIVLPSGKNVCPELVELALSKAQYVQELVVVPGCQTSRGATEVEAVKAIVRPDWHRIMADTNLSRHDLIKQPALLKNILWNSINKCQQTSQELAGFEKIQSKNLLEIEINEFRKTSTGKIKRDSYIEAGRSRK